MASGFSGQPAAAPHAVIELRNSAMRFLLNTIVILAASASLANTAVADTDQKICYTNIDPHACLSDNDPVTACAEALEADPYDLRTRLSLCGAHLLNEDDEESTIDAYIVVKKGLDLCGSDGFVCQRYKYAKSMIEESEEGSRRKQGVSARERCDYGRDLCASRLSSSLGIRGCDMALICDPDDASLHSKKGAKLLARNRPAEAIGSLREANRLNPADGKIKAKLSAALAARASLAANCIAGNSIEVCNNALLAGQPDEFDVQYRRGQLLRLEGREPAALQAFISAQSVRPDNEKLAHELVESLEPAIRETPNEAGYLRAQGLALLTIGSTDESIRLLRRASAQNSDDQEAARLLSSARARRAANVKSDCLSRSDAKRCYEMILKEEPDEAEIRTHIARILRDNDELDAALVEADKAARLAPDDTNISALVVEIRTLAEPPAPVEPKPEPRPEIGAAEAVLAAEGESDREEASDEIEPAPVKFSNAAHSDGRTY
jgi:tetratricopeptide (TPR) repeat protein